MLLKHLLEQGLKKTDIAAQLGVSRRLIYHWLKTGQLDRDVELPATPRLCPGSPPSRRSPTSTSASSRP